jgi:predicted outer membrane repeat protein
MTNNNRLNGFSVVRRFLFILLSLVLIPPSIWAATIYVSPTAGLFGTGADPSDPATLQNALNTANATAGDHHLLLQQGFYNARAIATFKITVVNNNTDKSITLSGGWNDTYTSQSSDPALTQLDGLGAAGSDRVLDLLADGGTGVNRFYLKRLSVQNGHPIQSLGAGIRADVHATNGGFLELYIEKCIFFNNRSTGSSGGGIFSTVPLEVVETTFESNWTDGSGGAVLATYRAPYTNAIPSKFDRCTFLNNTNTGNQGSAIYSGTTLSVTKSLFEGQTGNGSPIYFQGGPNLSVTDSKFYNNRIVYWGSAIQFWDTGGEIKNCLFIENRAGDGNDGYGAIAYLNNSGGAEDIKITNCTFFGNRSRSSSGGTGVGGAIHNRGANLNIFNSIFWDNGPTGIYNQSGITTLAYSDSQSGSGVTDGGNNLNPAVQCFIGGGNYELAAGSACVDAGTNTPTGITLPERDYAGHRRIMDGNKDGTAIVDIGAYEYDAFPIKLNLPVIVK